MGLRDILDDIRQKVVEEGWFGRATTEREAARPEAQAPWSGANATRYEVGRLPGDFERESGFGQAVAREAGTGREVGGREADSFERASGFGAVQAQPEPHAPGLDHSPDR